MCFDFEVRGLELWLLVHLQASCRKGTYFGAGEDEDSSRNRVEAANQLVL